MELASHALHMKLTSKSALLQCKDINSGHIYRRNRELPCLIREPELQGHRYTRPTADGGVSLQGPAPDCPLQHSVLARLLPHLTPHRKAPEHLLGRMNLQVEAHLEDGHRRCGVGPILTAGGFIVEKVRPQLAAGDALEPWRRRGRG